MLRGGKVWAAIVPGKPQESLSSRRLSLVKCRLVIDFVEFSIKPIEQNETDVLTKWIAASAPEVKIKPDIATNTPDPLVTEKEREFWAFQPPRPVKVPAVSHAKLIRNPIDAFVLQKLEKKGLSLSPEADRLTLLRRATFDLTGLPPEPAEVRLFWPTNLPSLREADRPAAGLAALWRALGRYWLDLAGYADSEGKREQDLPRPHAWRYRDYVIRSFNADKPYDRFLLEQIAGDELADYEHAAEITPEIYDNLVATGFLRMAPDAHLGQHHRLHAGSPGGDRRRDRRARLGRHGPDDEMRPLPQPQVRSDPAARLLPPGGCLQGGLRRVRLAQARHATLASAPSARTCFPAGICPSSRPAERRHGRRTTPRSRRRSNRAIQS